MNWVIIKYKMLKSPAKWVSWIKYAFFIMHGICSSLASSLTLCTLWLYTLKLGVFAELTLALGGGEGDGGQSLSPLPLESELSQ